MMRLPAFERGGRGGWQLVELSLVLSILGMVLVASTRTIIGLMEIERRSGDFLEDSATLERLGERWRRDLHQARTVPTGEAADRVLVTLADGRQAQWKIAGRTLLREVPLTQRLQPERETFSVPAGDWRFVVSPAGTVAAIERESPGPVLSGVEAGERPRRVERLEAAVGILMGPSAGAAGGPP